MSAYLLGKDYIIFFFLWSIKLGGHLMTFIVCMLHHKWYCSWVKVSGNTLWLLFEVSMHYIMTLYNAILDIMMGFFHILYLVPWGLSLLATLHYIAFLFLVLVSILEPYVFLWLNSLSLSYYNASILSHLSHCFPYLTLGLECTCRKPRVYLPSQPWWGLCGILWCVTGWQEVVISLSG